MNNATNQKENILNKIAGVTKERVASNKLKISLEEIKKMALDRNTDTGYPFEKALAADDISFICEVKKASPSKGLIAPDFPYIEIAKQYEAAGASAISCLTEPEFFKGSDTYLKEIKKNVTIPVLRKDFTVDEYMIYEAATIGADAILLICSILSKDQLEHYYGIACELGLSVLIETHDEKEIETALSVKPKIIGVNNRNLADFTVDINNSIRLRKLVPDNILFVSESGIKTPQDISALRDNKTNAVLIGETLMRSDEKKKMLDYLRKKTDY